MSTEAASQECCSVKQYPADGNRAIAIPPAADSAGLWQLLPMFCNLLLQLNFDHYPAAVLTEKARNAEFSAL